MEEFPVGGPRPAKPVAIGPLTGGPVVGHAAPRRRFNARLWRRVALALGLIVALVAGATVRLLLSDLGALAGSSGTPSVRPSAGTPAPSPSLVQSPGDSAEPSATPTPKVSFPAATAPSATVAFRDMLLESAAVSGAWERTISFTSDGQGAVAAQVTASAPLEAVKACLSVNGQLPMCNAGATPGFMIPTPPGDHADWKITLIGTKANSTPVVDVTFTWPTDSPSLKITQARFQGTPNPESMRGFTLEFLPREAGTAEFSASWGSVKALATIFLHDVTKGGAGTNVNTSTQTGTALNPNYTHAVEAGHLYRLNILNRSKDTGKPNMTATIAFP